MGIRITEDMLNAGYDATRDKDGHPKFAGCGFVLGHAGEIYAAMAAAAPRASGEFYIVWNPAKNEGFITSDEADAVFTSHGERQGVEPTVGRAFYEAYGEDSEEPLEIQKVDLGAVVIDLKASEMSTFGEALSLIGAFTSQFRYYEGSHLRKAKAAQSPATKNEAEGKAYTNATLAQMGEDFLAGRDYHSLAMRTAAGPGVFHYPEGEEDQRDLDTQFILDLREFLRAASKMGDWKSRLFYGKPKYFRVDVDGDREGLKADEFPDFDELLEGEMSLDFIQNPQLVHAVLGIASESGEIVSDFAGVMRGDTWQKFVDDHGTGMNDLTANMCRESGDIDWFQELLAAALDYPVARNRIDNIERLRKRFPDKFSEADAVARADEATEYEPVDPRRNTMDDTHRPVSPVMVAVANNISGDLLDRVNRYREALSVPSYPRVDRRYNRDGDVPAGGKRPVVVFGPKASGKTYNANHLAEFFGCTQIVEEWDGKAVLWPGDLALTNLEPGAKVNNGTTRYANGYHFSSIRDALEQMVDGVDI